MWYVTGVFPQLELTWSITNYEDYLKRLTFSQDFDLIVKLNKYKIQWLCCGFL